MMVMLMVMMMIMVMIMVVVMLVMMAMMMVVITVVMIHVQVADEVPGEGVVTGPGSGGQLLVLCDDGDQPLEAEGGQRHQEVGALLLGDILTDIAVAVKYSGQVGLTCLMKHGDKR